MDAPMPPATTAQRQNRMSESGRQNPYSTADVVSMDVFMCVRATTDSDAAASELEINPRMIEGRTRGRRHHPQNGVSTDNFS